MPFLMGMHITAFHSKINLRILVHLIGFIVKKSPSLVFIAASYDDILAVRKRLRSG
jgi:hypothetical protein